MKCKFSENDIALYAGGDVVGTQAFEIETHLLACEACRELEAELRESQSGLKSLRQDTVSAAALSAVRTRVLAEIGNRASRHLWTRWVYAVAGGLFVAVIAIGVARHILLSQGGVAAPSSKSSLPLNGAAGREAQARQRAASSIVGSTSDNPLLEPTILDAARCRACASRPSAPAKVVSRHSVNGRSHPSLAKEGNKTSPTPGTLKTLMVKLQTDDPNVVIYWIVDQTGDTL